MQKKSFLRKGRIIQNPVKTSDTNSKKIYALLSAFFFGNSMLLPVTRYPEIRAVY